MLASAQRGRSHHFSFEVPVGFNSGRLTSEYRARRRLTVNTLIGAPRGIARMALPIEPSALTSPEMIARLQLWLECGQVAHRVLPREKAAFLRNKKLNGSDTTAGIGEHNC
jgi:hypothetical protein